MLAKLVCAIIPGQKENPRVGVRTVRGGQGPPAKDHVVSTEELAFGEEAEGRALTPVVRKTERRARNNQRH